MLGEPPNMPSLHLSGKTHIFRGSFHSIIRLNSLLQATGIPYLLIIMEICMQWDITSMAAAEMALSKISPSLLKVY